MEVKIKYQDIIDRCEKLSSFESQGRFDANGESRYLEIHINEVDKQLVESYIKQATAIVTERISRMVESAEDTAVEGHDRVEVPDTTEAHPFAEIIPSSSTTLQNHTHITQSASRPTNAVDIVFMEHYGKFGYCEWIDKSRWTYNFYSDPNILDKAYVYEEGVKKVYVDESTRNEYTWRSEGVLIDYERKPITQLVPITVEGFTLHLRAGTRFDKLATFTKHVNEAVVAYVMAAWLKGRLDERVPFYEALHTNMLGMAVKNIFTKQAPSYE